MLPQKVMLKLNRYSENIWEQDVQKVNRFRSVFCHECVSYLSVGFLGALHALSSALSMSACSIACMQCNDTARGPTRHKDCAPGPPSLQNSEKSICSFYFPQFMEFLSLGILSLKQKTDQGSHQHLKTKELILKTKVDSTTGSVCLEQTISRHKGLLKTTLWVLRQLEELRHSLTHLIIGVQSLDTHGERKKTVFLPSYPLTAIVMAQ